MRLAERVGGRPAHPTVTVIVYGRVGGLSAHAFNRRVITRYA
jgi:hypothetical protein